MLLKRRLMGRGNGISDVIYSGRKSLKKEEIELEKRKKKKKKKKKKERINKWWGRFTQSAVYLFVRSQMEIAGRAVAFSTGHFQAVRQQVTFGFGNRLVAMQPIPICRFFFGDSWGFLGVFILIIGVKWFFLKMILWDYFVLQMPVLQFDGCLQIVFGIW